MSMLRNLSAVAMALALSGGAAMACTPIYTVQHGDTLTSIAHRELGTPTALHAIYQANQHIIGENAHRIHIGMELDIPCQGGINRPMNWAALPSAQSLDAMRKEVEVQILDIRPAAEVAEGVIPGSVSVPYSQWRGSAGEEFAIPSSADLSELIGNAGLRIDQPIVLVASRHEMMDNGRAAMVYWLLKSSGVRTLAILLEGFEGWELEGLPIAAKPVTPVPYDIDILFSPKWRGDELDIYGIATEQKKGSLLDARPIEKFVNLDDNGNQRASTLPKAQSSPVSPLLASFAAHVPVEDGVKSVISLLRHNNANWRDDQVVTFCQTGELAALSWFYASELAGYDNIRVYPESVTGWASHGGKLFVGEAD